LSTTTHHEGATTGLTAGASSPGWLRSPGFDLGLIVGVLALALALGGLAAARPELFGWVILFDFWMLAYPHVASTYTRVAFDRESVEAHRFLLFGLPLLVVAATGALLWLGGAIALNSLYFYWQTHHYTKQSYGIARAYQLRAGAPAGSRDLLADCVVFAFPIWGLLHRAHQRPPLFYGAPLWCPPAPAALVSVAAAVAVSALAAYTWRELRDDSPRAAGPVLFLLSHVVITVVSYVAIDEITRGWLFINVWHNAQYLLFVWAANARRFRGGVDPKRTFVSWLSQPEHVAAYVAVCLGIATVFYLALGQALPRIGWRPLQVVLVVHMAVNFHHYLVDAVIWRARRPLAVPLSAPRA
jgi:hypothetical protein